MKRCSSSYQHSTHNFWSLGRLFNHWTLVKKLGSSLDSALWSDCNGFWSYPGLNFSYVPGIDLEDQLPFTFLIVKRYVQLTSLSAIMISSSWSCKICSRNKYRNWSWVLGFSALCRGVINGWIFSTCLGCSYLPYFLDRSVYWLIVLMVIWRAVNEVHKQLLVQIRMWNLETKKTCFTVWINKKLT